MQTPSGTHEGLDPNRWLDCHGEYLYRYALLRVRESVVAEDLLQQTLLAAVSSDQGHAGRGSERTWLVGIMKAKVIDYFRRLATNAEFQLTPADGNENEWFEETGPWRGHWREDRAPISWPINTLESHDFWETFERCLSQLPQQMSVAFTLREIDGLTSTEICEILNVTPSCLKMLLHRSRAKMRDSVEKGVETRLSCRSAAA